MGISLGVSAEEMPGHRKRSQLLDFHALGSILKVPSFSPSEMTQRPLFRLLLVPCLVALAWATTGWPGYA
ncbi:MAG TPA: hypothetical protein VGP80_15830 [Gemmatimonadales bacterium]|jgi:hypothetical protein|nr:hypothetical protein [Gemmatimonadales bacterium]